MRTDSAGPFCGGTDGTNHANDAIVASNLYEAVGRCAPPGTDPEILVDELLATCRRLSKSDGVALAKAYGVVAAGLGHLVATIGPAEVRRLFVEAGSMLPVTGVRSGMTIAPEADRESVWSAMAAALHRLIAIRSSDGAMAARCEALGWHHAALALLQSELGPTAVRSHLLACIADCDRQIARDQSVTGGE